MASWNLIDSRVISAIKTGLIAKHPKFTDDNFTSLDVQESTAVFPMIKIKVASMPERGMDFEGDTINAVDTTFQIDVMTNKSQDTANKIVEEIIPIMKRMRFQITSMPISSKEGDVFRSVIRCKRSVGSGDSI